MNCLAALLQNILTPLFIGTSSNFYFFNDIRKASMEHDVRSFLVSLPPPSTHIFISNTSTKSLLDKFSLEKTLTHKFWNSSARQFCYRQIKLHRSLRVALKNTSRRTCEREGNATRATFSFGGSLQRGNRSAPRVNLEHCFPAE